MITLLFTIVFIGIVAYGITALPMPAPFRTIAYCVLCLIALMFLANALGYPMFDHRVLR